MFACLYLPPPARPVPDPDRAEGRGQRADLACAALVQLAREFSPRIETHGDRAVTLDLSGLGSLFGEARAIGDQLRRHAADAGLRIHIAVAATSTVAMLLAHARAGLTVVPVGAEAATLAPLPLSVLSNTLRLAPGVEQLKRWGLRTLGDLAAIPAADLSERLGQDGVLWQRWARGEDARPLVPAGIDACFEASLDLEWPIDGLEPLSFVLARLLDPLCERLEIRDRGAVALNVRLTLVTREIHKRSVVLPAPMRDARVLRTLALIDLETHPPPAAIDRVTVGVDVTEGRVLQFGLFARALPTEKLATLVARLGALMGSDRVGAPALVDSYRPGAFAMGKFEPAASGLADRESLGSSDRSSASGAKSWGWGPTSAKEGSPRALKNAETVAHVIRRFRLPIPARVTLEQGRPVRVATDRRGFSGGTVACCEGPWHSSGDWWVPLAPCPLPLAPCPSPLTPRSPRAQAPWNCDEWDVALSDGASYRISQARSSTGSGRPERAEGRDGRGQWFVDGMLD